MADVVMMLRIQMEREKLNIFPSLREYSAYYCLNRNRLRLAKPECAGHAPGSYEPWR